MRSKVKYACRGFLLLSMVVLGIFTFSGCLMQVEEAPTTVTTTVDGPTTTVTTTIERPMTTTIPSTPHPLQGKTLQFGVIHSSPTWMEGEQIATTIAVTEIHAYAQTLGLNVTFSPLFENAEESARTAREKFETLVARDVKFCLGLQFNSHCKAVLEEANEEHILLISSGYSQALLAIPDDWLYRMGVPDWSQGPVIAKMIHDYGIEAMVCIQRADVWADGIYSSFKMEYGELGGIVLDRIRYDPSKTQFSAETELLNDAIEDAFALYDKDHVGVLDLEFSTDFVVIQALASYYPNLMSVPWFGSNGNARWEYVVQEIGDIAVKVRNLSPLLGVPKSNAYSAFAAKYKAVTGYDPRIYDAMLYDSVWLLAKSILESDSMDSEVVRTVLPQVAANYYGASGWCKFNEDGDRVMANFDIWGIVRPEESQNPAALIPDPNQIGWEVVGGYDPILNEVIWFTKIPLPLGK